MYNDVSCYVILFLCLFFVVVFSLFVFLYFMKYLLLFFFKIFFSFYIEIKVFSCDIYFVDNVGEIVCYLIGENYGYF